MVSSPDCGVFDVPVPPQTISQERVLIVVVSAGSGSPVALVSVTADGVPRFGVISVGEVASTAEPDPVTAETAVPLILKLFPVPAVSKVLLVKVSVVALPINVSVAAGRVRVPEAAGEACRAVAPEVLPATESWPVTPDAPIVSTGETQVRLALPASPPPELN